MLHLLISSFVVFQLLFLINIGRSEELSWGVSHVYGGSRDQPFTKALNTDQNAKLIKDLVGWFNYVAEGVQRRRTASDGSECTLRGQKWINEAVFYMTDRDLPKPSNECATRTEHTREDKKRIEELLDRASDAFEKAGSTVLKDRAIKALWGNKKTYPYKDIRKNIDDQTCTVNYATAIRIQNGTWYIIASLTSSHVDNGGSRHRIVEHIDQDLRGPLKLKLSSKEDREKFKPDEFRKAKRTSYTTAYAETKGSAHISRILNMQLTENLALNNAVQRNLQSINQAEDATTKANFAILILPLMMSFIPVALVADVSDIATLFYVLLTDVFSAVPFIIKGIELVITGSLSEDSAETWLIGEDGSEQVAETWIASCKPKLRYQTIGIIIICVGLITIIVGILLEFFARKWMSRKRDMGENPEPFGPALLRIDSYIPVGANFLYSDANYDDALGPNFVADVPPPEQAASSSRGRFPNKFLGLLRQRRQRNGRQSIDVRSENLYSGVMRQGSSTGALDIVEYYEC